MGMSSVATQDSGEETKEEAKEDELVILEEAVNKLEGCFGDDCYPASPEWDYHDAKDMPQEPPIDCRYYYSFCLKTPCVFLQYQDKLKRVVKIVHPKES
jgi:hypothetical protein